MSEHPDVTMDRLRIQNDELRALVAKGYEVVADFLPNIGHCVLQDYARLNTFMVEAGKFKCRTVNKPGSLNE